ncbi:TetR/AcrR family transcriptional regulator, partial [Acinetobacter baumannii]|uniref:TetR/AcrR family transcriptional regulator n=1 Tax=Acinetobacter baumannii TaxID=470 RepID=UPI0022FE8E6D
QTSSLFCIGFLILYSSNMYGDEIYLCNKAIDKIHLIFNWYIDWVNSENFNGCLFKKAFIEVSKQYTSIREPFQEYTNWLINLLNSLLVELDIKDPTPLTHIIISIIDGIIIDGTIDKDLIDPSKKWQYIEYLIKTENP